MIDQDQIMRVMKDGPMTARDVSKCIGLTVNQASRALSDMAKDGKLSSKPSNKGFVYRLPTESVKDSIPTRVVRVANYPIAVHYTEGLVSEITMPAYPWEEASQ